MELIDIIQLSITIFGIVMIVVVATSYLIYKVKDKDRVKPYAELEPIAQPVMLQKKVQKPAMQVKPNLANKPLMVNHKSVAARNAQVIPAPVFQVSNNQRMQNDVLSYYSNNEINNMHKVRFSVQNQINF